MKHDGRNVETLVVHPESKNETPVVLIIHEIFGLSDWVQDVAEIPRPTKKRAEAWSRWKSLLEVSS